MYKRLLIILVFSFFFNNLGLSNEKYICIEKIPNTVAKYNLTKSSCPDRGNSFFKIYKNKYPASFNKLDIYYITKWRSNEPDVDAFGIDIISMTRDDKIFGFNKGEIVLMPNVILNNKKIVKKSVKEENCDSLYIGKTKIEIRKNVCISEKDIKLLLSYKAKSHHSHIFPDEIEKVLSSKCGKRTNGRKRSSKCLESAAGGKVYELFVKRKELYHARYPGKIIEGMAWFEILYLYKHSASQKRIDKYVKYGKGNYQNKKEISSLIKMNKGRLKMRKAVGLNPNDDLNKVLDRHIVLSNFLNKDRLKVKKNKIEPEIKKREELLKKYKIAVIKYKEKLEEVNQ